MTPPSHTVSRHAQRDTTLIDGGEGGHSKLRIRAPTEGACPLVSPHAGESLPRDSPLFESHHLSRQWSFDSHAFPILLRTFDGGEGGIRTHGPVAETHAFQACRFVHSRTSPRSDDFKGWHLITQAGERQGKGRHVPRLRLDLETARRRDHDGFSIATSCEARPICRH